MNLKPHTLYWALTDDCQLRCRYCFYQTGVTPRHGVSLPREDCNRLLLDIARHFQRVVLTGGEPAMHSHFAVLAKQARQLGLEFGIVTNGYALDAQILDQILAPHVDIVNVSLDSMNSDTQSWLRPSLRSDGYPDTLYEGLERLAARRADFQRINILQTITRKNIDDIKQVSDYCRSYNLTHYVHPVGWLGKEPLEQELSLTHASSSERAQLAHVLDYWAAGSNMEHRYRSWMLNMCEDQRPAKIRCRMGSDIFFLDVDASLYPCFHRRDVPMGNLLNERVKAMLDNAADTFARSLGQIKEAGCLTFGCLCIVQQDKRPGNCSSNTKPL